MRLARSWAITAEPLDDLDDVLRTVGFATPSTSETELALRRLVARAADDELAARIVIQRILPGLLALARRRSRSGWRGPVIDEAVGAAWIAIRTFDQRRRPACLAAALIADADHRAFRAPLRRASSSELPVAEVDEQLSAANATASTDDDRQTVLELADAARLSDDERLLLRGLVDAPTIADLAEALAVSPRTVRNRRDRIARRLRAAALAS